MSWVSTLKKLWREFLPLSLSDVTMAMSDPLVNTTLAHLPASHTNLAAVGIAKSLAVFFESPIIMFLHAANSLAGTQKSRRALWQFVRIAMFGLSVALLILCLPPLFNWIGRLVLGAPPELINPSREVLLCFVLWPAVIACRRFFQGLMIRFGHAKDIAYAGVLRIFFVAAVLGVGWWFKVPGHWLAGLASIMGIISETTLVVVRARRACLMDAADLPLTNVLPTTQREIWSFYWPLANSMIVLWGGRALLVPIISRAPDATVALAAWPAAWGIVLLLANATRMVQQVIVRHRGAIKDAHLLYFAITVGAVFSTVLLLLTFTPVGLAGIHAFVGDDKDLVMQIRPVLMMCCVAPLLVALQNAFQGFLIGNGHTRWINWTTWISSSLMLSTASIAVFRQNSGTWAAASAMLTFLVVETGILFTAYRLLKPKVA